MSGDMFAVLSIVHYTVAGRDINSIKRSWRWCARWYNWKQCMCVYTVARQRGSPEGLAVDWTQLNSRLRLVNVLRSIYTPGSRAHHDNCSQTPRTGRHWLTTFNGTWSLYTSSLAWRVCISMSALQTLQSACIRLLSVCLSDTSFEARW